MTSICHHRRIANQAKPYTDKQSSGSGNLDGDALENCGVDVLRQSVGRFSAGKVEPRGGVAGARLGSFKLELIETLYQNHVWHSERSQTDEDHLNEIFRQRARASLCRVLHKNHGRQDNQPG